MLSFIIIGRNEGWKLTKCLQSVFNTIAYNKLNDSEVIYVDSNSTDDSIKRAKDFKKTKIFLITGVCNAAIARNIGANEAKGDILFFIDGDMEIEKDFIKYAIINGQLKYDCITGHLDDYLYNINDKFLGIKNRTYTHKIPMIEQQLNTNGGIFLIKKEIWRELGGMHTKYKRSQDIDLSLRIREKKYKIVRLPHLITKHHTIDYYNEKRMWSNFKQAYCLYPGLIFREHLFYTKFFKKMIRSQYTALLFAFIILTAFINQHIFFATIAIYLLLLMVRIFINIKKAIIQKNKISYFIEHIIYQVLVDIVFWTGFLFFFPKNKKEEYTKYW